MVLIIIVIVFIIFLGLNKKEVKTEERYTLNQHIELDSAELQNESKRAFELALESFMLLLFTIVTFIGTCILIGKSNVPGVGGVFIVVLVSLFIAILAMRTLNTLAKEKVNKYNLCNTSYFSKIKKINSINRFQIPVIIISMVLGVILSIKLSDKINLIKEEIEKRYGNEYKILYKVHRSNENGLNETEALVEVEGLEQPLYVHYDITRGIYSDNYDSYLKSKEKGYENTINKIFNKKIFSHMEIYDNYEGDERAIIILIVDNNNLINKREFTNKLQRILDEYRTQYMHLRLAVYLTDKLDFNKKYEYKLLAISTSYSIDGTEKKYSYLYNKYINFYIWNNEDYDVEKLYEEILKLDYN